MKKFDINNIQLTIQSPHINTHDEVNDYLISRIEKAGNTFAHIEKCEVVLRIDNNHKNKECEVDVKLFVPGNVLFAKEKESNFLLAAKNVFDDLQHQLQKIKEKHKNGRENKNLIKTYKEEK